MGKKFISFIQQIFEHLLYVRYYSRNLGSISQLKKKSPALIEPIF